MAAMPRIQLDSAKDLGGNSKSEHARCTGHNTKPLLHVNSKSSEEGAVPSSFYR